MKPILETPSPNFGARKDGKRIEHLILHYTGMPSAFETLQRLQDKSAEVSAHYLVDEDGTIHRLVPEEMRAWHAGVSYWAGETDINSTSIGIEIQNPGHKWGYRPFPPQQMQAVAELCTDILTRHPHIRPYGILGHSDVAPERKGDPAEENDPGELFDWKYLATEKIGLWPYLNDDYYLEAEKILNDHDEVKNILTRFGYNPSLSLEIILRAFQSHYHPEIFTADSDKIGQVNIETIARLLYIYRKRLELRPKTA